MYIGNKIKELRKAKGMTLVELSEKSGVQIATLSRIENEKMVGSLESHMNMAKALGVDITHLYANIREDRQTEKTPKKLTDAFVHNEKASFEILTSKVLSKKMMPIIIKIEPRGQTSKEQNSIGTEKFVFVLEGNIEVKVGKETCPLVKHSTFYFDASAEHCFVNTGKSLAKVICVASPVAL